MGVAETKLIDFGLLQLPLPVEENSSSNAE